MPRRSAWDGWQLDAGNQNHEFRRAIETSDVVGKYRNPRSVHPPTGASSVKSRACRKSLRIRLGVLVSLGTIAFASIGMPLPALVHKDRSKPFPCMGRACGCMSAEECKHGCCCFSNKEKLAWALRNGVDPSNVADMDAIPIATVNNEKKDCCAGGCCHKRQDPACFRCTRCQANALDGPEDSAEDDRVLPSLLRNCRGAPGGWLTLGIAGPITSLAELAGEAPPSSPLLGMPRVVVFMLGDAPPTPPP